VLMEAASESVPWSERGLALCEQYGMVTFRPWFLIFWGWADAPGDQRRPLSAELPLSDRRLLHLEGIESVVSNNPAETQGAYQTGALRFGVDADNWSASIFVDNVWNEYAELFINNRFGNADGVGGWAGGQRVSVLRPRTIGIQLRFDF